MINPLLFSTPTFLKVCILTQKVFSRDISGKISESSVWFYWGMSQKLQVAILRLYVICGGYHHGILPS